jgi:uncharacterized membrane protein YfcA
MDQMGNEQNYFGLLLFFILTLFSEVLGTIGGFGSSIFFVSISQYFFDFQTVLALTGLLHVFSNTSKIILFRKTIDWKLVLWLGVPSIVLAISGAYLNTIVAFTYARLVLGIFLILFSTFFFMKPSFNLKPNISNSLIGGSLAGFLAGFVGTGGAVRGVVLTAFRLEKKLFVGTSSAIDFGVDISRTIIYLDHKYLTSQKWIYIPLLIAASFGGSYLGQRVLGSIKESAFRNIVLVLIFLMGITLVAGQFI